MNDGKVLTNLEDLEELENLEDLEELEELSEAELIKVEEAVSVSETALADNPVICLSEDWLSRQVDLNAPLVLLDAAFDIRWRNQAFQNFRETPGLEYRGRPFFALFADFAEKEKREELISTLKNPDSGYGWQGRAEGRGHDNRWFQVEMTIMPLEFGSNGLPEWYLAVITDMTETIKRMLRANFDSILQASLLKDEDTGNHVLRVNAYSRLLAEKLKGGVRWVDVDDDFIENIGFLAAYHDVGKIGTPEVILLKNGKLDEDEWKVMKEHPINGALILDAHPNSMAKEIARSHHERWDGTGYPFGLEKEDIPLAGRIVMIADVYDALRTRRPYKKPFSEEKAIGIIVEEAGSHFDPYIVEAFKGIRKDFARVFNELNDK